MDRRIIERRARREAIGFIAAILLLIVMALLLSACAQIKPEYDEQGRLKQVSSFKTPLMGDLNFETAEKVTDPKTGAITEKSTKCSTSTNADKIIDSANKFIGTGLNAVEKAGAALP